MNEEQFNRLLLWQQEAAQIACSTTRYEEAHRRFGHDENFEVAPDGSVGFIDRARAMTFAEATGRYDDYR